MDQEKPHVVFVPLPSQSHIKCMLKLARLLHHQGLQITFINTESYHRHLLKHGVAHDLDGVPGFQFKTVPDGHHDETERLPTIEEIGVYLYTHFLDSFLDLVAGLEVPPTCTICDAFINLPNNIYDANKLKIPIFLYWTMAACGFMAYYLGKVLFDKGVVPLKDVSYLTNGYTDTLIEIPGMEHIRLKDLPEHILATNLDDLMFHSIVEMARRADKVSHIIIHTFDELEAPLIKELKSKFPHIYTVGPQQLLLNHITEKETKKSNFNGHSLWKEEPECIQWLESKELSSVVYVNFGSHAAMSIQDLVEFGWGLVNSDHYFLWIIRDDLVDGNPVILPQELMDVIKKRGFIASWCSQEEVLNHPSVGGFLTHGGWSSVIESLSAGVPMICCSFSHDKRVNCRQMCKEWEVGLEIEGDVKREKIEKHVKALMEGAEGKRMRKKAMAWKKTAEIATDTNGSSSLNVGKLAREINMLSRNKLNLTINNNYKHKEMDQKIPHVVFIPLPAQSHIKCMLKLARLLHHQGLHVTFVNIESYHRHLLKHGGAHDLDGVPGFQFKTVPDGHPLNSDDETESLPTTEEISVYLYTHFLDSFLDLVAGLEVPPTCIICDAFMNFPYTIYAAEKLQIPIILYWTMAACGFMAYYLGKVLFDKGVVPLKDESYLTNGYTDTLIEIPGMEQVRLKDLPEHILTTNPNDVGFYSLVEMARRADKVSRIIIHTFDELEAPLIKELKSRFPHIYTVGPQQLLLNHITKKETKKSNFNGHSLWKEEPECVQWLESKEPNSVVYVNFGSHAVMSIQDLIEFGWGLVNSEYYFLWIIRADLVDGKTVILPQELMDVIKKRGFIASWCSQEEVLKHPSVGGFLTHGGWGSVIESLSAGVPMICRPFSFDQRVNCRQMCKEWKVGMEIEGDVKRDEVEKLVNTLMGGADGKRMRMKAMAWKKTAEIATDTNGSSSLNVEKLARDITMLSKN